MLDFEKDGIRYSYPSQSVEALVYDRKGHRVTLKFLSGRDHSISFETEEEASEFYNDLHQKIRTFYAAMAPTR